MKWTHALHSRLNVILPFALYFLCPQVHVENTSRKSPTCTGEVELLEFFAQRRACDDLDREIVCSDVRALACGIRNALLAVTPLWLALALWFVR